MIDFRNLQDPDVLVRSVPLTLFSAAVTKGLKAKSKGLYSCMNTSKTSKVLSPLVVGNYRCHPVSFL